MERNIKHIELEYPSVEGNINGIEIDLCCVRASNSILVEFSHKRNGWVISMPSVDTWDIDDEICDPKYVEVAFVEAWKVGGNDEA